MKRIRFFPSASPTAVPKLVWLELTEILLRIAYDLFAWSKKLRNLRMLHWLAMRLLHYALLAIGHAPAESYTEAQADLPVRI